MPRHTGWEIARRAAWDRLGRRHYRWFVGARIAADLAPWVGGALVLVGLGLAVRWVWRHLPHGTVGLLSVGLMVLVLLSWGGAEVATVSARRRGVTAPRVLAFTASGLLGVAAVLAFLGR
jgi:hypothetical protein